MEVWKDIPSYEGLYQVSNLGNIKSNHKTLKLNIGRKPHSSRHIYTVCLFKDGKKKTLPVHRLVASAFLGKSKLTINHINGNPMDNRVENLEYCTLLENIKQAHSKGLCDYKNKPIKIHDKTKGKTLLFKSQKEATTILNLPIGFFSKRISRGVYENELYKWKPIIG